LPIYKAEKHARKAVNMKVFLHIGPHKTATTAIQDFATVHSDWLLKHGLFYPSFDLIARSHLGMIGTLAGGKSQPANEDPILLLHTVRKYGEEHGCNLFFSAESLFRMATGGVARCCALFREVFERITIVLVCSLRPQAEFAESLHRNGYRAYVKTPADFVEWLANTKFDYSKVVFDFQERLQSTPLLIKYSRDTQEGFIDGFFEKLGVPSIVQENAVRQKNPSFDVVDCLAKKLVLGSKPDHNMSKAFNNFAFNNRISTKYAFLYRYLEEQFLKTMQQGNDALITLENKLRPILQNNVERQDKDPIGASCWDITHDRANSYWTSRSSKS
jgi:hypothetical protein